MKNYFAAMSIIIMIAGVFIFTIVIFHDRPLLSKSIDLRLKADRLLSSVGSLRDTIINRIDSLDSELNKYKDSVPSFLFPGGTLEEYDHFMAEKSKRLNMTIVQQNNCLKIIKDQLIPMKAKADSLLNQSITFSKQADSLKGKMIFL